MRQYCLSFVGGGGGGGDYHVPEKRLHPIAIELHGRWHPKSRQAIKDFMKTELADGPASDITSLSWRGTKQ